MQGLEFIDRFSSFLLATTTFGDNPLKQHNWWALFFFPPSIAIEQTVPVTLDKHLEDGQACVLFVLFFFFG